MRSRLTLVFGTVFLLICLVPSLVLGNSKKITIKNPHPMYTANDLHVVTAPGKNNKNNTTRCLDGTFTPAAPTPVDDHTVQWPPGSGSCPPMGSVTVAVNTPHGGQIDEEHTGLTLNGTLLTPDSCLCGCGTKGCYCGLLPDGGNRQHFYLGSGGGGPHTFTIINNQPLPVVYTNAQVWLENDNSIGQIDSLETFYIPSGFLSSTIPSTIEIPAFSDTTFELEPYTSGYDLFLADVYPACNPSVISPLASADIPSGTIPTLGTVSLGVLLLVVVALGVYLIRRRRAQSTV